MLDNTDKYKRLAVEYFNGTIMSEQESVLLSWLMADSLNMSLFRNWEKEWSSQCSPELLSQWQKLELRIRIMDDVHRFRRKDRKTRKSSSWPLHLSIAAVIVLSIIVVKYIVMPKEEEEQYFLVEAPGGERSRMMLPDNTLVWLNSGSSLKISDKYNRKNRNVILEGEGYFEVTRNEELPFVVRGGVCNVTVLGTRFSVSAYHDDPYIRAAVLDGCVSLSYETESVRLVKGQVLDFNKNTLRFYSVNETPESAIAWKDNRFEYDGIKLEELAGRLSREYGVTVHFLSNKHLNERFNISLRNNESISEIVSGMQKIVPFDIKIQNDTIFIN